MFVAESFDIYSNPDYAYTAPVHANTEPFSPRRSTASTTPFTAEASSGVVAASGCTTRGNNTPALQRHLPVESAFEDRKEPAGSSGHTPQSKSKQKQRKHDSNDAMEAPSSKRRRTEDNGSNGNGHHLHTTLPQQQSAAEQPCCPSPSSTSPTPSLEAAIAALPPSQLRDLVLRHARAHEPLAADVRRAYASTNAARCERSRERSFDHHSKGVWYALNVAHRGKKASSSQSSSQQQQRDAAGAVYGEVRAAIQDIGAAARPPASFATRRNALVALRKMGKAVVVCLSEEDEEDDDDDGLGRQVARLFQEGETAFVDAFEEIVEGLGEEEKAEVRAWTEGGEAFEDKLFELVGLAEERNVFDGLSVAAEKLGLVFDYGDSDEGGGSSVRGDHERRVGDDGGVDFAADEREVRNILADETESSGHVYSKVIGIVQSIRRAAGYGTSFQTRRNALITLRRIADLFVMTKDDDPVTRGIQEQFRDDNELSRTFVQILGSMSSLEKKTLLGSMDEDMSFGGKIFETVAMAKANGIMTDLQACLDALRLPSESLVKADGTGRVKPGRETLGFSTALQGVSSALNVNWHAIRKSDYEQITAATAVYNRLIDLTTEVDRAAATTPSVPFSTRRHALVKLLKVASMILRTVDRKPAAAYPIKGRFLNDDILGPTCRMIAYQMTNGEKRDVLKMRNGKGLTLEAELVKIVKLAKRHNILLGMRNCLAQLRWQAR